MQQENVLLSTKTECDQIKAENEEFKSKLTTTTVEKDSLLAEINQLREKTAEQEMAIRSKDGRKYLSISGVSFGLILINQFIIDITFQCFQIALVPRMFPIWDFVVEIFALN